MAISQEPEGRDRAMTVSSVISEYRSKPSGESLSNDTSVDEDVVNYIRLNTQMASQAHEGTSFYLRFGCLCKYILYKMLLQSSRRVQTFTRERFQKKKKKSYREYG